MKEKYPIITSVGVCVCIVCIMLISTVALSCIRVHEEAAKLFCYSTIPLLLGAFVFPFALAKIIRLDTHFDNNTSKNRVITICLFLCFALVYYFSNEHDGSVDLLLIATIIHYLVVGISEEYACRVFMIKILSLKYSWLSSVIVSALIFTFILHNEEDLITNLIIRFPLGIAFGIVTIKSKCSYHSMLFHAVYDLIVVM